VIYEDLTPTPEGWAWSRYTVTLRPPDAWSATAVGNYRTWRLDYRLRPIPGGSTEFTLRGRRRATMLGGKNPAGPPWNGSSTPCGAGLGRAMEREYRATHRGRTTAVRRRGR